MRNTRSSLKRRRRPDPMKAYDNLPPALRAWLRSAALPWSPQSALLIWRKAYRKGGTQHAIARLNQIESGMLAKDRESLMPPQVQSVRFPLSDRSSGAICAPSTRR